MLGGVGDNLSKGIGERHGLGSFITNVIDSIADSVMKKTSARTRFALRGGRFAPPENEADYFGHRLIMGNGDRLIERRCSV